MSRKDEWEPLPTEIRNEDGLCRWRRIQQVKRGLGLNEKWGLDRGQAEDKYDEESGPDSVYLEDETL